MLQRFIEIDNKAKQWKRGKSVPYRHRAETDPNLLEEHFARTGDNRDMLDPDKPMPREPLHRAGKGGLHRAVNR